MAQSSFEWDSDKADSNFRKYGVNFAKEARVFIDPFAIIEQNRITDVELRWQAIGDVDGS